MKIICDRIGLEEMIQCCESRLFTAEMFGEDRQ